jgi:hypothetical protein
MIDKEFLMIYAIGQVVVQINEQVIGVKDDQGCWDGESYEDCLNRLQQEGWKLNGFERNDGDVACFVLRRKF